MPHSRKIATCCYCGRRAELVLTGTVRHELSCASCGAPLHNLKRLRADTPPPVRTVAPKARDAAPPRPKTPKPKKDKRAKRRKGFGARLLEDLFDAVEDIFD